MGKVIVTFLILAAQIAVAFDDCAKVLGSGSVPFTDTSRLKTVAVTNVYPVSSEEDIRKSLECAKKNNLKISLAGSRHSQGGQTFAEKNLILDMKSFNKVRKLDVEGKVITVESGATWEDVQAAINPKGLAVQVMQASPIFTIGGSLSANAHGRDPKYGAIAETVLGFRLLTSAGKKLNVSRTENSELFGLVIGGLGLFGVILDVDLKLTENVKYTKSDKLISVSEYTDYFAKNVNGNSKTGLQFGWPSIRQKDFLDKILFTTYERDSDATVTEPLLEEENMKRNSDMWVKSKKSETWKAIRWNLQEMGSEMHRKHVSRNNAMRPEIRFMYFNQPTDSTDPLQEYFVPVGNFVPFIKGMKEIFLRHKVNLMSMTVRHVKPNSETFLSYAAKESFAFVFVYNQKLTPEAEEKTKKWTRELVDLALQNSGTYYLVYQNYPTVSQLQRAYPNISSFFSLKQKYDSEELFVNQFYLDYFKNAEREPNSAKNKLKK